MYKGQALHVQALGETGIYELCFDRAGSVVNKLDALTMKELSEALGWLGQQAGAKGLLLTSAKSSFIAGADISEFDELFSLPAPAIATHLGQHSAIITTIEDLKIPSVVAINGFALGGGLELALAAAYRVVADDAKVGLPEAKLGIYPGYGGTVRLPRLAGLEVACEWITSGNHFTADAALTAGAVDASVPEAALRDAALDCLSRAVTGELDWQQRQQSKRQPLSCDHAEVQQRIALFQSVHQGRWPAHQPARGVALGVIEAGARLDREGALALEVTELSSLMRTQAAYAMTKTFSDEQQVKKLARAQGKGGLAVNQVAVLGAGIMGGGIAFTSALSGIPARMKDISSAALDQGLGEAGKQLARQIKQGRLKEDAAVKVLESIKAQTDDAGLAEVDLVVEAIVERLDVKQSVLKDLEAALRPGTVIASNTSSLRISDIATSLVRPESLVGMHFFNPVHMMPLVEIVRGNRSSAEAVATATAYAMKMGKTPIVVADCPGFLVNRLLTAYMRGFLQLIEDGADFQHVDCVMEAFGWPMGPAYLEDVIGMDTGSHVNDVISAGYPQRMPHLADDALRVMVRSGRFGQKSGKGFYRYEKNPNGKPTRTPCQEARTLLAPLQRHGSCSFNDSEILDRMLLPMIVEAAHALEEGVVSTPAELDLAIRLGLGFPAYAGGPLHYADWMGLDEVVRQCDRWQHLGEALVPTSRMREMARLGHTFHS